MADTVTAPPNPMPNPYPDGTDHTTGDGGDAPYAVGRKFNADGSVRRFAGNTVICTVPENSPLMDALIDLQAELAAARFAPAFAFLPASSFHMTLFEGVNDPERSPERWPRDVPLDTPLEEVTRIFVDRLSDVRLANRFMLEADGLVCSPRGGSVVTLSAVDADQERTLRSSRDLLSERLRHAKPNHAGYRFHITLSYQTRWLDIDGAEALADAQRNLLAEFRSRIPRVEIGDPAFCVFDDMTRFDPVLALG